MAACMTCAMHVADSHEKIIFFLELVGKNSFLVQESGVN